MTIDTEPESERLPRKQNGTCAICLIGFVVLWASVVILFIISNTSAVMSEDEFNRKVNETKNALDIMIQRMEEKNVERNYIDKLVKIFNKFREGASHAELKQGIDDMTHIYIHAKTNADMEYIIEPLLEMNAHARYTVTPVIK